MKSREVIIQCCEDLDDLIVGRRRRRFRQGTINRWFWSRPYGQKVGGVEKEQYKVTYILGYPPTT